MKPPAAPVAQALPVRPPARLAPQLEPLAFPLSPRRLSELRRLRKTLFEAGKLNEALAVAKEIADRDPGRESFLKLGILFRDTGRYPDALKCLRDALRFKTGPAFLLPEIHLHAAYTWLLMGRTKEMGEALRRAREGRLKPRSCAAFNHSLGNLHFSKRRYREACAEYAVAEAAYEKPLHRGRAAVNQGLAMIRLGDLNEAGRHLERAIRILKRARHPAELAVARLIRAEAYFDEGQFERALGMALRASRIFRQAGNAEREAASLFLAGCAASEQGSYTRCRVFLNRCARVAGAAGLWHWLVRCDACRATACAFDEEFEASERYLGQAKALLKGRRDWVGSLHIYRAQARIGRIFGNWKESRFWARRAERLAKKVGDLPRVIEFRKLRADAEAHLDRRRAALHAKTGAQNLEILRRNGAGAMHELERQARRLARTRLPMLLVGEAGVGKTELARKIHSWSERSRGPLIVAPCEHLVFPASDLSGHVAGAWSGAVKGSPGLVARARGGTLVLDRVDELAPESQRVLIRLVEGWVRPVGGAGERPVDVRIIAACRQPGRLLPALQERFSGAILRIPSLAERSDEVSFLVQQALQGQRRITCDAVAELAQSRWEGNIPELLGAVERLVAASSHVIGVKLVRAILKSPELCRHKRVVDKKRRLAQMAAALT